MKSNDEQAKVLYASLRDPKFNVEKIKGHEGGELMYKMAKNSSEDQFVDFCKTAEPTSATKLTQQEMSMLKGGSPIIIGLVIGIIAAIVGSGSGSGGSGGGGGTSYGGGGKPHHSV